LVENRKTEPAQTVKNQASKWRIVLRYCVMEAVAIVGGINFQTGTRTVHFPESSVVYSVGQVPVYFRLWDRTGALAAFIVIAAGVNLYFIRRQPIKIRVITTAIVIGALLATALGMKAWNP